jgi:TonB family protein
MNHLPSLSDVSGTRQAAKEEVVGLLIGTGFTLALFLGLAHFENFDTTKPGTGIGEIQMAAMPFQPPTSAPLPKMEAAEAAPFAGLEIGASDSPVSVPVVPPNIESLIPSTTSPLTAGLQSSGLYTDFKPQVAIDVDSRHVYQESDVDQRPYALVRTTPIIPLDVRGNVSRLHVVLLVLINQNGKAESVRVKESSGNPRFDEILANTVQNEWLFSPGIRRNKKVRVLAEQSIQIDFVTSATPFDIN